MVSEKFFYFLFQIALVILIIVTIANSVNIILFEEKLAAKLFGFFFGSICCCVFITSLAKVKRIRRSFYKSLSENNNFVDWRKHGF